MTNSTTALLIAGGAVGVIWITGRLPTQDDLGAEYGWRYGFRDSKGNVSSIGGTWGIGGFAPSAPFIPPGPRPVVKLLGIPGNMGYYIVSGKHTTPIGQTSVTGLPDLYAIANPNFTAYEESLQWHEGFAVGESVGKREGSGTGNIIALVTASIQLITKVVSIVAAAL